jgi:hypothetical protein
MPLTASQIVTAVLQTCKAPAYTTQAQQQLNLILADLADTQDLDLCRGQFTGTFIADNGSGNGSGPYLLPMDYKRVERDGAWYLYNGISYPMISVDLTEYEQQVQQSGLAALPELFATDVSPLGQEPPTAPLLYVWPPASLALTFRIQYRRLLPDLTNFGLVPWFPNQAYLRLKLTAVMMEQTDDTRKLMFEQLADKQLEAYLKLTNDDEGRAKTVTLDRRRFGQNLNTLPDTKQVWG